MTNATRGLTTGGPASTGTTTTPCSEPGQNCGGQYWVGPTCCQGSSTCVKMNAYFSKCSESGPCSKPGEQCGGQYYFGPTCCQSNSTCSKLNAYVSKCSMPPTPVPSPTPPQQQQQQ